MKFRMEFICDDRNIEQKDYADKYQNFFPVEGAFQLFAVYDQKYKRQQWQGEKRKKVKLGRDGKRQTRKSIPAKLIFVARIKNIQQRKEEQ